MNSTPLFWIDGPRSGRLAIAARPRGGDWLEVEMEAWRGEGVRIVLSLLTPEEAVSLDLKDEATEARVHGISFHSFPIPDREVPSSPSELASVLEEVERELRAGGDLVVHCRQGIGRSGLVAACLLVNHGLAAQAAIDRITAARGVAVPETSEQRQWIDYYAGTLAGMR